MDKFVREEGKAVSALLIVMALPFDVVTRKYVESGKCQAVDGPCPFCKLVSAVMEYRASIRGSLN